MLDEIKGLDEKIHLHNAIAGKDPYGTITDEWLGYYKFYFVRIEKGEIKEELRIDIGDGEEVNQKYFEYLYEQISKENAQTKEEIVQEEVVAEQKEEPSKEEAQTTHINEYIKNYFSIPSLAPSLTVRVDEKDYDSSILKEYFKNFEFADGRTLDNFNPFKEDEKAFDLVKLTFFKNQDGEYRVMYNSSNSLMYNSELDSFIQNLDIIIEDLKIKESLEKNAQTKEEIVQEEALVEQKEEPSKEEVQTTHINEKLKLFREIQELKELIKERELDHSYADSFEQSAQITGNIVKLKNELAVKENSYNKIKESLEENVQTIKKNKGVER